MRLRDSLLFEVPEPVPDPPTWRAEVILGLARGLALAAVVVFITITALDALHG